MGLEGQVGSFTSSFQPGCTLLPVGLLPQVWKLSACSYHSKTVKTGTFVLS